MQEWAAVTFAPGDTLQASYMFSEQHPSLTFIAVLHVIAETLEPSTSGNSYLHVLE